MIFLSANVADDTIVHMDKDFSLALLECLKRGINCWPSVEKADVIRRLIDEMENAK